MAARDRAAECTPETAPVNRTLETVSTGRTPAPVKRTSKTASTGPTAETAPVKCTSESLPGVRVRRKPGSLALSVLVAVIAVFAPFVMSCARTEPGTMERIHRTGELVVGTDATYPPFESIDPKSGDIAGFDVDLVRALAVELGLRPRFIIVPFDGIIPGLKSGKYDVVVSAMTITPARATQVGFTKPYVVAGQSVAVRANDATIQGAADLTGRRIGCQLSTTGEIEARKVPNARVVSFDAIGSAFRDLENGNLDAVIADTPTARIFIRDHPSIRLAGEPLTREEFGMAVRPADGDLLGALNGALDKVRANGQMDQIMGRWGLGK